MAVFGVCYGSWQSELGAWLLTPLAFFVGLGPSMTGVGVPCTRLYAPLERVSAYSFGCARAGVRRIGAVAASMLCERGGAGWRC